MDNNRCCLGVVRVRGKIDLRKEIKDTLNMLSLNRNNQATIIRNTPSFLGMLKKIRNQIAWGEVTKETILLLLKKRGRISGNKKVTEEYVKKIGYNSLEDVAKQIFELKLNLKDIPNIKPVFRLHPPKKGFKGTIKKSYEMGGVTGNRRAAINDLLKKMI